MGIKCQEGIGRNSKGRWNRKGRRNRNGRRILKGRKYRRVEVIGGVEW